MSIIQLERNAPCICGSGKKYKKCCLFTIEKLQRHWDKDKYLWLSSELAYFLALVCGLPQREGETIPSLAEIEESLDYITEKIYQTDDEKGMDNLFDMFMQFEDLLSKDQFDYLLFPAEIVAEFLDIVENNLANLGREPGEEEGLEIYEEQLAEYLPKIIDEEMTGHLLLDLLQIMRQREYTLAERAALVNALQTCLVEPKDNPAWEAIFRVSVTAFLGEEDPAEEEDDREADVPEPAWPIVRAYIPEQICWNIGGLGSSGVVQEQSDGRYCLTVFYLSLPLHSIDIAWSKRDLTAKQLEEFLAELWLISPPWQEGSLDMASRYIWGTHSMGEKEGYTYEHMEPYLRVIPQPQGSYELWLEDLLHGGELTSPGLTEVITECGSIKNLPEGKEFFVWTSIIYRISDPRVLVKELAKIPGFKVKEDEAKQEWIISWIAESPEGIQPVPENIRTAYKLLGTIRLTDGIMRAESKILTLAVRLAQLLSHYLGEQISYESVAWTSYQAMIREIEQENKRKKKSPKKNKSLSQKEKLF